MTTKHMVALCSTCLVVGGLMGAILFDMTQSTWERDQYIFLRGTIFADWYRIICHRDAPDAVADAVAVAVTRDGVVLTSDYFRALCPSGESEGVSANDPTEVAVAAQSNDDTFTQRVGIAEDSIAEDSAPEPSAAEAANDDSKRVRWTSSAAFPNVTIKSQSIHLGEWVDADLLESAQTSSSAYTWDSPVLFQVLRELRALKDACLLSPMPNLGDQP